MTATDPGFDAEDDHQIDMIADDVHEFAETQYARKIAEWAVESDFFKFYDGPVWDTGVMYKDFTIRPFFEDRFTVYWEYDESNRYTGSFDDCVEWLERNAVDIITNEHHMGRDLIYWEVADGN